MLTSAELRCASSPARVAFPAMFRWPRRALPPDANCLLSVADRCLRSRSYVNVIVIDKQPQLQYLTMDEAVVHCARGAGIWEWAGIPAVFISCSTGGRTPTGSGCATWAACLAR